MASTPFHDARAILLAHREQYDEVYRSFRWPKLERFNWALDWFDPYAVGNTHPALWLVEDDGTEVRRSFADLAARSTRLANLLRRLGARRGDRLLLMLPNVAPLWEAVLACMKLGVVLVPTTTQLGRQDLADRMSRGEIRHIVTDGDGAHRLGDLAADCTRVLVGPGPDDWSSLNEAEREGSDFVPDGPTRADDPLLLYFTSGTTARPKLVLHTHQSYPVGHLSTMYWLGCREGDVHWNISSPGWAKHAWSSTFAPWNAGATVFGFNYARFDARRTLETIVRCGVTTLCAPPTVWRMLVGENLPGYAVRLREVAAAGEPLNPEVIERVRRAWGLTIRDGYGQTETTAQVGNSPGQMVKPGSMGRPLPGYRIALLDEHDRESDEGEIALPLDPPPLGLMRGYLDEASRSTGSYRGGYYRTGDIATRDADGYLTYVGRSDDVFKSSDYRISPFELESAIVEHPEIAEAAVVPSPDPLRLNVPKAFVVVRAGSEPSRALALRLFQFLRDRLPRYKRIRCIEFTDLPKTISGKIRRVELRSLEATRRSGGARVELEFWEHEFTELSDAPAPRA